MTIQIFLTLALVLVLAYALFQRYHTKIVTAMIALVVSTGVVLIWFPNLATQLANLVGVGRGADLVFYAWVVLSILLAVNVHAHFHNIERQITLLARHMALFSAQVRNDVGSTKELGAGDENEHSYDGDG